MNTDIQQSAPAIITLTAQQPLVEYATHEQDTEFSDHTELQSFYRSGAFSIEHALNPMVAAASPVLTLATKLHLLSNKETPETLETRLAQELYAFDCTCKAKHYRIQTLLAARYALCALLDELIHYSDWGKRHNWPQNKLLKTFYNSDDANQFYTILDRARQEPEDHRELLELYYLCLSLGYHGEYRQDSEGQLARQVLMDKLYHGVRRCRGHVFKQLSLSGSVAEHTPEKSTRITHPYTFLATIGMIIITAGVCFNYFSLKHATFAFEGAMHQLTTPIDSASQLTKWTAGTHS
ncbi:MAG: type IVB secretion system protein IcmH/DotU [Pseudomonadota bacterium]|nr:type IVB secretion system protein IcmH/DotU [Pseudomonadota bacterium]